MAATVVVLVTRRLLSGHPGLTPETSYLVVGGSGGAFRVIDDQGEPTYSESAMFISAPSLAVLRYTLLAPTWEWSECDRSRFNLAGCGQPGFYESLFERDPNSIRRFDRALAEVTGAANAEPVHLDRWRSSAIFQSVQL